MEILGAISTVLIIVSLVDQGAKVLQDIARVSGNTGYEIAKWDLWGEKKAIDAWASNMRRNEGSIPEEEKENVNQILYAMRGTLEKLEARMKKYEPFADNRDKPVSKPRLVKLRIAWLNSGQTEVQDLLQLVKTLTRALNIVAPPLPEYSRISGQVDIVGQPASVTFPRSAARQTQTNQSQPVATSSTSSVEQKNAAAIQPLFNICLKSTFDMVRYGTQSRDSIGGIEDRLSLWQQGLFGGALGLEVLLSQDNTQAKMITKFLLSSLVDIAYTEEQILTRWLDNQQVANRNKLEHMRSRLTIALARDEITLLTLERWKLSITEVEAFGPKTDEEDLEFISNVVDILFDVLPAIRALRRTLILIRESEARSGQAGTETIETVVAGTEAADNSTIELIDANLQQAKDLEREAQVMNEPKVTIMSKRLAKTIQRLEEWRIDALQDPKVAQGAHSNPEVLKKQEELARVLSNFYRSDGKQKDLSSFTEKLNAVPNRAELTPENLEALVETVDFATRHLFAAT